jgi:DNA (cytosine-5)-methyltransferase 1
MIKVLNLYSGIGGNRKLWENVEVTAVENNPKIAKIYKDFFPDDKVVVDDAHQYLVKNYQDFDFIWSSPPCPSHSKIRNIAGVGRGQNKPVFPDMRLYEEIIFLKQCFMSGGVKWKGKYVVENVVSYYKPLITPLKLNNHYFWSNFNITNINFNSRNITGNIKDMARIKGIDLTGITIPIRKDTLLRNCLLPELGKHVFDCAFKEKQAIL